MDLSEIPQAGAVNNPTSPRRRVPRSGRNSPGDSASSNTISQFDRLKGANWFESAVNRNVLIIGAGGIGSWTCLMHSRIGSIINIFDNDSYEMHNLSGQLARAGDVGKSKVNSITEICRLFSPSSLVYANNETYTSDQYSNNIIICALDNMDARKIAFERWVQNLSEITNLDKHSSFFQDGRLLAEHFQIFNIPGNRPDLIELYRKEHLFDDKEVADAECTFKQTSHCAAMIASHMVGFYTNWLSNLGNFLKVYFDTLWVDDYCVPFKFEYVIPFNLSISDYARS